MAKIAIIGAGISGLVVARQLKDIADISIFEKARGVGGRMSTRYADPYQFDHGAQSFTARTGAFQSFLKPYIDAGHVEDWTPKILTLEAGQKPYKRDWFEPHYVGVPKMNSLCKAMADGLNVQYQTRIETVTYDAQSNHHTLTTTDGQTHQFDWVISTAPPIQTLGLLPDNFVHRGDIQNHSMKGCFTLMLGFDQRLKVNWDAASVKNSCLEWLAFTDSKPGRDISCSLIIHSTNDWAEENIDRPIEDIQAEMLKAFQDVSGVTTTPDFITTHRWRYAYSGASQTGNTYYLDEQCQFGVCGDWCIAGRVEAAFTSANELSTHLKRILI